MSKRIAENPNLGAFSSLNGKCACVSVDKSPETSTKASGPGYFESISQSLAKVYCILVADEL